MDVMNLANSIPMWIACGIPVLLVIVQAVLFAKSAYGAGKNVGLTDTQMKKAMKSSAVTSISSQRSRQTRWIRSSISCQRAMQEL